MALQGVVTSDWHLNGLKNLFKDHLERQLVEIHKPYKYALEHGIQHVFIPGDLSDVPNLEDNQLIALITILLTYDGHINTWYLLGNHDVESVQKTSIDVLNVLVENGLLKTTRLFYTPAVEKIQGVYVNFIPFPETEVTKTKLPPLVFAHIEQPGALGDNGLPLRCKKEPLKRVKGDFVISGHIHQYQQLRKKRLIYNGSLYQKTFGEKLPKGFIDFKAKYVKGELVVTHEFVNSSPNFTLQTVTIKDSDDWSELSDDPSIKYRIYVEEGVIVPNNITHKFPNIHSINGAATARTRPESNAPIVMPSKIEIPQFSPMTGLVKYLKEASLSKDQRIKAKEWVIKAEKAIQSMK